MSTITIISIVIGGGALVWNIVSTIMVYYNLRKRGEKVSFIWLRTLAPWYVNKYKNLTQAETGKVGALYYHWVVSINLLLVSGILVIVSHKIG